MNSKREERAIDALLVSQLRSNRDNVESLPELTSVERMTLDSLGADFVDRLLAGDVKCADIEEDVEKGEELVCGSAFGMNRAKELDETTRQELDRKRQEIIDRVKKNNEGSSDDSVEQ